MNIFKKLFWRITLLVTESSKSSWDFIFYMLLPNNVALKNMVLLFIFRRNRLFSIKEGSRKEDFIIFETGGIILQYKKRYNISYFLSDFLSIVYPRLSRNDYIEKNFLSTNFFEIEGKYETGRVSLKQGDYVIDAGASIGMFSIVAAKRVGSRGKVFSFEPIEQVSQLLAENLRLNNISNTEIKRVALGDTGGELDLVFNSHIPGSASGALKRKGTWIRVEKTTIDTFVKENNIKRIDFIKADIEGMERDLLMGARETIKRFKPKISICTYHRQDDPLVLRKLIKDLVPEYNIIESNKKLYAHL